MTVIIPADAREESIADNREPDDLDGLRIRQVYQLRRSLYRARRYWLVGAGICIVAAGQILWNLLVTPGGSTGMATPQAILLAAAFIAGAILCLQQARRLARDARQSILSDPERPPDLSSLSDGSQYWKNLESMRQDRENQGRP
jgi:hypothetical protein